MVGRVDFTLAIGEGQNLGLVFVDFDVRAIGKFPLLFRVVGPVGICDADRSVGIVHLVGAVLVFVLNLTAERKMELV